MTRLSILLCILISAKVIAQEDSLPADVIKKDFHVNDPEDIYFKDVENDSSMYNAYIKRAIHRKDGGYYKGAIEDYTMALKLNDTNPALWFSRALLNEKIKNYKGAINDYTKVIALNAQSKEAFINRAKLYINTNQYAEAINEFTSILNDNPSDKDAWYYRSQAKFLSQKPDACNDLKKSEELGKVVTKKDRNKICRQASH